MDILSTISPVLLALLAATFTWGVTALGAACVFIFPAIHQKVFDALLGFAGGVMLAASYWSLLSPAIALSEEMGATPWLAAAVGFIAGGVFLWVIDRLTPHLHLGFSRKNAEGIHTKWSKTALMFLAVTIHNIPEGLAIGVAFGSLGAGIESATLAGAIALAFGIGIQNFPEGFAISVPFRAEGMSRWNSFLIGQSSALVEPIAAVIGALLVLSMRSLLPYALAFAAGAMIFVTIEQIIPESQKHKNIDTATIGTMLGFVIMMILDVALG